ncbi:NADPH:quinone reductase-like Zn-dependent oxidoreductase [Agromyces sp. 3263]|uniref:NADP-dependent oxidoreductase n=1 Tax=Agromyces sp. 3263 TaxID=2817750 RepID=UPI002855B8E8|nr:NADP-dependent oxidoreductase [Agromyces sp. 3263]MDR6906434.1 NADPH:quinone reductase-like Zn-dependent oxidoreductase [Agromyces sp. 3263]
MRAIQFTHYGEPTVLEPVELPRPEAGRGEVLVRVAGTTFNEVDASIRAGHLTQVFPVDLPHVPGIDVSGTVIAVGEGISAELVGQDIVAFLPMTRPGASAEYAVVPADLIAPAPRSISLPDAAALASSGLTAWQAIVEHGDVRAGQRVLVNGAGGGVGGFAVQLAAAAGATVIATASARSRDAVTSLGASQVIDYTTTSVVDAVTEPVDVVVNLVRTSPEQTAALVSLVKPGGVFVSTTTPGEVPPGADLRTVSILTRSDAAQLAHLAELVDAGELRVDVSAHYPLDELATVHALGEAGSLRGKVVLTPTREGVDDGDLR